MAIVGIIYQDQGMRMVKTEEWTQSRQQLSTTAWEKVTYRELHTSKGQVKNVRIVRSSLSSEIQVISGALLDGVQKFIALPSPPLLGSNPSWSESECSNFCGWGRWVKREIMKVPLVWNQGIGDKKNIFPNLYVGHFGLRLEWNSHVHRDILNFPSRDSDFLSISVRTPPIVLKIQFFKRTQQIEVLLFFRLRGCEHFLKWGGGPFDI